MTATIRSFLPIALKDALLAAAIALGLSLLMIGVRPVDLPNGLGLSTHWNWVVIAVLSVFTGRFLLMIYWLWRRQYHAPLLPVANFLPHLSPSLFRFTNLLIALVLIALAIALPFLSFTDRYVLDIATLVLTYIMLGWGLNIVVGLAGLLDLGYVGFYAVGAYSFALLSTHWGLGFWMCLPLAGLLGGLFGVLLGYPVLRLRGDYLAIVTLGFGEIIRIILLNWYQFTGGPNGISDIPRPSFFGLEFTRSPEEGIQAFHSFFNIEFSPIHRIIFLYYVILGMALLTNLFTLRIRKLPIGRAWEALREDEIACRSLGINPTNTKLTAFGIGAMFGGFAGAFFATRQGFISPESFSFIESALILAIVVLGGMGRQMGVVFAAILLIGVTEFFRELQEYRMLAFGGGMVLIMVWRPRGLLSHRDPTILLQGREIPAIEKG
ncbi:ABC-type branched-chain amino acid transport system, permease component [Beggiatoa alba B18LD]|uniref:ABC-type branched-chain amino acid transport system, permease component n=1 Tax=Beggiatoa alba B18LD TaxID=395493 RepID=I3CK07_9GAMM|nr:high-affinity branched-chain amino acid ABC transporter permease LivM [Beggiatoa alba]EIJ43950.1 ABC-type branched-chain amino acid transport system, permease component [Beggiatoa alba B18LD]